MNDKSRTLLFLLILGLALLVRLWKIEYLPYQGDADELAYVFAGTSFLEKGTPISWSSFYYDYHKDHILSDKSLKERQKSLGYDFIFVYPWFDHPPLLPLLEGFWAESWGYSFPDLYPSLLIRLPMLLLAAATLLLVFLITRELYGYASGVFSLILMGFSPALVMIQRMVVGENLYLPLILLTIYLMLKNRSLAWLIPLSILSGWAKFTGLIVVPIVGFYLLSQKKFKRTFLYIFLSVGLFALGYILYGFLLDWPTFVQMMKTQSFRLLGWSNPAFILSHPGFHNFVLFDASYYLLLILGLAAFLQVKTATPRWLQAAVFGSLLLVWLTSSEQDMLGWYKLPLFTFLTIASGWAIKRLNLAIIFLLAITVVSNFGLVKFTAHPYPLPWLFRATLVLIFGPLFVLLLIKENKVLVKLESVAVAVLLVIYIGTSFYVSDKLYQSFCENKGCPVPVQTLGSVVRSLK